MSDQQSLGIAILAGGRSRRFDGRPKGCLTVDGRPLLQRVIDAASPLKHPMWLVRATDPVPALASALNRTGLTQLVDDRPDMGPLGALTTILAHTDYDRILLLACDMPFLTESFLAWLVSRATQATVVVPGDGDHLHPLCSVFHRRCESPLRDCVEAGRFRAHDFIFAVDDVHVVPRSKWARFDEGGLLMNVNTDQDLERAETLAQSL